MVRWNSTDGKDQTVQMPGRRSWLRTTRAAAARRACRASDSGGAASSRPPAHRRREGPSPPPPPGCCGDTHRGSCWRAVPGRGADGDKTARGAHLRAEESRERMTSRKHVRRHGEESGGGGGGDGIRAGGLTPARSTASRKQWGRGAADVFVATGWA
jgi:hypothetical protein